LKWFYHKKYRVHTSLLFHITYIPRLSSSWITHLCGTVSCCSVPECNYSVYEWP
jgi:hypothetical protein